MAEAGPDDVGRRNGKVRHVSTGSRSNRGAQKRSQPPRNTGSGSQGRQLIPVSPNGDIRPQTPATGDGPRCDQAHESPNREGLPGGPGDLHQACRQARTEPSRADQPKEGFGRSNDTRRRLLFVKSAFAGGARTGPDRSRAPPLHRPVVVRIGVAAPRGSSPRVSAHPHRLRRRSERRLTDLADNPHDRVAIPAGRGR